MNLRLLLFVLSHYSFLGLLALFAYLIGARVTRSVAYDSASEKFSFCTGLGLGVIASAVFLLGLLHLLLPAVILTLFGIASVLLWPTWKELRRDAERAWRSLSWKRWVLYGIFVVLVTPVLLLPLYPPTQWDATSYHLAAAKIYANSGAVVFTPYLRFPVFPQLNEMLFTLALLLCDDLAAQLVQFLMMLLVAMALYAWGSRVFNVRVGLWSAVLWLSNPLVLWLGASAYVDVGLAMFLALAAYAFLNGFHSRSTPWLLVSAAFFGFAAGTKYLALFPLLGFGLFLLYRAVRERRCRALLAFAAVAIAIASPWYIRNAWYTGNPVWPYFGSKLGYGIWTAEDAQGQIAEQTSHGTGKGALSLLLLPWNLTFHPAIFRGEFALSGAYLILLPLCLLAAIREAYVRVLLVTVGLYTLFWFSTVQVLRYLLPAVPLLSVATAATLGKYVFRLRWAQAPILARALTGSIGVVFLVPILWTRAAAVGLVTAPLIPHSLPPVKAEQRTSYLKQSLPVYSALEFLNRLKGDKYNLYAIPCSNMAYFADGGFMGDWYGVAGYAMFWDHLSQPEALYQQLRKLGANYFLVDINAGDNNALADILLSPNSLEGHLKIIYANKDALLFEIDKRPVQLFTGPELLKNSGFEQGSDGTPESWSAGGKPFLDNRGSNSHTGKAAVRAAGNNWLRQRVPVEGGALYVLRNFSRATNPAQLARLQVHWLDREQNHTAADWRIFPADLDWHAHAMAAQAPTNAAWAEIYASAHEGEIWLDDFSLVELQYK